MSDTNGDGTGDAILSFPGGEKITLTGVSVSAVSSDAQLQAMGIPGAARDYIVEGTGGDDTINDGYTGDPEGDRIDAHDAADGSDDDSVRAGAGDDVIDAGSGNDTIDGGAGDDEVFLDAALQNDSIIGGEADEDGGGDRINLSSIANDVTVDFTGAEAGTISDGSAVTTFSEIEQIQMGTGDDSVSGSAGAENILGNSGGDTVEGNGGDDTIDGGDDADLISGGAGNDSLMGGAGADTLSGGAGDDQIDLGLADGDADLLQMGDGGGSDVVSAFEAPTDNGDGTFSGQDMLDVSDLHDAGGDPVSVEDVAVSDTVGDGTGNAILSFPGGETITLLGVTVGQVSSPEQLEAMGIPAAGVVSDYIVEGTSGADSIDAAYTGDPEGDMIDAGDAADGSDDDSVEAGAGNDTIEAGLGDDTVRAGAGDDLVHGGAGNDEIYGFEGSDTVFGGDGDDTINTRTSLGTGVPDEGYADSHGSGLSYPADTDPENDRDSVEAGAGNDSILTGDDDDTISGGSGDDTVDAGFDDDSVQGDTGEDWLEGNEGSDTLEGGADADTVYGDVAPSNANYAGYVPYELANDGSDDAPDNNADSLSGGAGDDSLYGQDDDDTLRGGDGADLLDGGIDNDALYGGEGADTLIGGAGDDYLELAEGDSAEGGAGDDTFRITDLGEAGSDGITVVGGEGDETAGDTLEFGGLTDWSDVTYTNSDPGAGGGLSGSAVLHDGSVVTFSEIENVVICFTAGTRIATAEGPRAVEDLRRGDLVVTRDHGLQKVRWAGQRRVAALGSLAPVRFDAGALGNARPLLVSPQHRMLITGPEAALLFGDAEVLASAKHLVNGGTIRQVPGEVTYVHILFDRHEIVYAEGAASESFFPGDAGIGAVDEAAREELFTVFPELRSSTGGFEKTARICLRRHESRLFGIG
ncbi:Hint domain-containing protein [Aquicoccus sp. G2-2]|uniref:Hint domain-containing protein n=1 Tax=Aquicoccus sp. G2-2 TaxID=3092120 RepID=UPI002AE02A3E|nr:Hint domain-containing protein [Aquicoccus sp. G2-2]MEA1114463.1 Hint domain-containing protein [Aquicoccus sp. G2-2]